MKINNVEINPVHIDRIEQDSESLHIVFKDNISDDLYDEYCSKLGAIYPDIINTDVTIMWYPITDEEFVISF